MSIEAAIATDRHNTETNTPQDSGALVQQWYGRVLAYCQSRLLRPADAEDAAQETFLRCFAHRDKMRSPEAIGPWLRSTAHHVCVDTVRRLQVRKGSASDVESIPSGDSRAGPVEAVIRNDSRDRLIELIHELPEAQRETILLHYYQQMTYDQMAQWLGVARSTVNERLSKARSHLRQRLAETEDHRDAM